MKWIKISLIVLFIVIAYLSLKRPDGAVNIQVNDKIGHLLAYFTLSCNLGLLFSRNRIWAAGIIAFLYSCLLEYLQGFVPGRSVDGYDLIANGSGVFIGMIFIYLFGNWIKNSIR